MREQPTLTQFDLFAEQWVTHCMIDPKTASYAIVVRGPNDPERKPKPKDHALRDKAPHLMLRKKMKTPEGAKMLGDAMLALLQDGKERTFNAICVEVLDLESSICFREEPENVIWKLAVDGLIEFTRFGEPIRFRLATGRAVSWKEKP